MATVEIELELVGSADGVPMELAGTGSLDPGAGQLAFEVRTPRRLLLFDPAFIAIGLLDLLALVASHADPADPEAHVHVRSRTDLYDENGREAGGWRVVATLKRTSGGVLLNGQLLEHVARIEPGERVVAVDAPWGVMAQAIGDGGEGSTEGVLLAGAWDARTGRGNGYRGITTLVADGFTWPGPGQASQMTIGAVEIRRVEDGSGETVGIVARVATDLLAKPPQ